VDGEIRHEAMKTDVRLRIEENRRWRRSTGAEEAPDKREELQ